MTATKTSGTPEPGSLWQPGNRDQAFAYQFGYIRAMLQAVESAV